MAAKKKTTQDTDIQEVKELTITLPNRSALWQDANTASGYTDFIPAGTYPVKEIKCGFTLIEGRGWVHCIPEDENQG